MTIEKIDNALKSFYLDALSERLNTMHLFLARIEKTSRDVWGKQIRKFKQKGCVYMELKSELKNHYGTIELSEKALRACEHHAPALVNLLNSEMEELLQTSKENASKNLFEGIFNDIFGENDEIYGVKRANHPFLQAKKVENFGVITESKLADMVQDGTNFIITTYDIARKIRENDTIELENGLKCGHFNGIPVISDKNCPKNTMYLLNANDFTEHLLCDWMWLEGDDGKILRKQGNKPIYTATLVKYADIMCDNPSGQVMLSGVEV